MLGVDAAGAVVCCALNLLLAVTQAGLRGGSRQPFTARRSGAGWDGLGIYAMCWRRSPGIGLGCFAAGALTRAASVPVVQGLGAVATMAFGALCWHLGFPGWGFGFASLGLICWLRVGR